MDWLGRLSAMRLEAHYGDRVVSCFVERPRSVHQLLAEAVRRNPHGDALIGDGRRLSWLGLFERAGMVAAGLAVLGIGRGDRVALLVGNRIEFVLALFGASWLGAIAVPLGIRQQAPEIAYALNDCGARLILCDAELVDRLPARADMPALEHRIILGAVGDDSVGGLAAASAVAPLPAEVDEEDTAFILYTSGTTGRPKGAMLTHLSTVHSAMVFEICMGLTTADRSLAAVPLAHVTGMIANIAALTRCAGALVLLPAFKAADFLRLAAAERITQTVMVPAMYNLCLLQPDFADHDLSAWRIGGYGGAPMPQATIARLAEKLPRLMLINAYGATETTSPSTLLPPAFAATHADSVGKAVPGATVIVVDDNGRELPRGDTGEVWIHGAMVVRGYWNNPAATAQEITGGYWHSGDVGSLDADGFLRLFDRKKDMINRGGHKVFTAEVESVLAGHLDVLECAVVAKPCPVLGERVHAFVVPRAATPDIAALRAYCAARLSDYKVPETVTVSPEPLPRNANGKVLKRDLRDKLAVGPRI